MGLGSDEYVAASAWRSHLARQFRLIFASHDLIVTPATGVTSKTIGNDMVGTTRGEVFYRSAFSVFTALVNAAGNPASVGPIDTDGTPPPALQLVAPQ